MPAGYVRASGESLPGNEFNTPTLSTKKVFVPLLSFNSTLGAKPLSRDDELRGQDEPLPVIPEAYDPTWSIKSRLYPDTAGFFLKLICGAPTTTAGNGVITDPDGTAIPTGAFRHVWTAPFGPAGASPLTAQFDISYVDQTFFLKQKGAACQEINITSPESGGVQLDAQGPANYQVRVADPSLGPAYEALTVAPFERSNLSLPTFASGGTTEDIDLKVMNPVATVRSLSAASKFADVMEKDNVGPITFTGVLKRRQINTSDWDNMVNNTGFAAIIRWVNASIIASSYPYKLYVSYSNAQLTDGDPDDLGNKRRHGGTYNLKSTTPSAGSTVVTLVNATTSYV